MNSMMEQIELRLKELGLQPMNANSFAPIPESELEQIEEQIGVALPDDYRWFATRYGKSLFTNGISCPSAPELGPIPFAFFYGANSSRDGVLATYDFSREELPRGVVPIGEDGM